MLCFTLVCVCACVRSCVRRYVRTYVRTYVYCIACVCVALYMYSLLWMFATYNFDYNNSTHAACVVVCVFHYVHISLHQRRFQRDCTERVWTALYIIRFLLHSSQRWWGWWRADRRGASSSSRISACTLASPPSPSFLSTRTRSSSRTSFAGAASLRVLNCTIACQRCDDVTVFVDITFLSFIHFITWEILVRNLLDIWIDFRF